VIRLIPEKNIEYNAGVAEGHIGPIHSPSFNVGTTTEIVKVHIPYSR